MRHDDPEGEMSEEGACSEAASGPLRADMPQVLTIVLVCSALIGLLWLIALQRIVSEREQAVAAALKSNSNLAIAFEQQVFRMLKSAEQVAVMVRELYLRDGAATDLSAWVGPQVARESLFNIISVVDPRGDVVASTRPTALVNYADRAYFRVQQRAERDGLYVSEPVLGRVSGRWQIPMSMRITQPDGRFGGVVVLSVDPVHFTDFYRQADLGRQGLLEITGIDGIVRGRKSGGQASFGDDARALAWFQRRAAHPEGGFVDDGRATDGVTRIMSYRTVEGYPLMVAVGTAYDDEMAPVAQRRAIYVVMTAGVSVALLVLAGMLILALRRQRAVADALRTSEALFRATFHLAAMGIAHIAPDGRILRANGKFCRMLGYSGSELRQRTVFDLGDDSCQDEARQFLARRLSSEAAARSPEMEKTYRRKDGSILWVCEALGGVRDAQGRPDFLVAVTQDITEHKLLEERLSHQALHDPLTGLPNRAMFHGRLAQVLESARRHGQRAAVLYMDLDGFKAVNDGRGHAAGDALLRQVAQRLESCVRAEDTVARLGGDEFGIVLATVGRVTDCEALAHKIIEALAVPFQQRGEDRLFVSASVGIALYPIHGADVESLLAHADRAMYAAKQLGKSRFSWEPSPRDDGLPP